MNCRKPGVAGAYPPLADQCAFLLRKGFSDKGVLKHVTVFGHTSGGVNQEKIVNQIRNSPQKLIESSIYVPNETGSLETLCTGNRRGLGNIVPSNFIPGSGSCKNL